MLSGNICCKYSDVTGSASSLSVLVTALLSVSNVAFEPAGGYGLRQVVPNAVFLCLMLSFAVLDVGVD